MVICMICGQEIHGNQETYYDDKYAKPHHASCWKKTTQIPDVLASTEAGCSASKLAAVTKEIKKCDLRWLNHADTGTILDRILLSTMLNKLYKAAGL